MIQVLLWGTISPVLNQYAEILNASDEIEAYCKIPSGSDTGAVLSRRPDIIILDTQTDTQDKWQKTAEEILCEMPQIKIILLTMSFDDKNIYIAFSLGITGYFIKNAPPENIIPCVMATYQNHYAYIHPAIADRLRNEFQDIRLRDNNLLWCTYTLKTLTQTELDVLALSAQGYTRQQICELRCVELSTVKTQIRNILKKFRKNKMQELIAMLNSLGIIDDLPYQADTDISS